MPPSMPVVAPMPASRRLVWAAAGWAAGLVGTLVVSAVVLVAMIGINGGTVAQEDAFLGLSMGTLVLLQAPLWLALVGTPLLARRSGLDWRSQLGWSMRLRDVGVGAAAGLALQLLVLPLLYWQIENVFGDLDVEGPARELMELAHTPFDAAMLLLMTVVLAPLSEELFFRGLLQGALQQLLGPFWALAIASAVFAATHFQVVQFPALAVVGAVHGLLFWATGRLGAAVCSHAVFNAVTVTVLLW